jgi:hypothetical protein
VHADGLNRRGHKDATAKPGGASSGGAGNEGGAGGIVCPLVINYQLE